MTIGNNIRNRLILFFIVIIIIPSLLITLVMYYKSTLILSEKKGDSIINGLLQTSRVIDSILNDTDYQLTALTINTANFKQLQEFKRKEDYSGDPDTDRIWSRVNSLKMSNRNIESIYIYLYGEKVMFTSYETRKVIEVIHENNYDWLNISVHPETNSSGWVTSYGIPPNLSTTIGSIIVLKKLIKTIYIDKPIGEACVAITESYIRSCMLDSIKEGNNGVVLLLDKNGNTISAVNNRNRITFSDRQQYAKKILDSDSGYFVDHIKNERMLVAYTTSKLTGWKYVSMIPFKDVILNVNEIRNLALVVNILAIGLAVFLAFIFSQSIYKPIKILKDSMQVAQGGNLNVRITEGRDDEFGMLNYGFNQMINRIRGLIDELYHEKLLKKDSELKNLEAQINPHFLYNTLDSLHWLARLNKMEEVSKLTFSLSNFYRLTLSGGKEMITVKETLDLIQEYLYIQQMRYPDKFHVKIQSDESLMEYQVLRLIIQPLVENAIYHGIEKKKGRGNIRIEVYSCEKGIVFAVHDDGVGISSDKLKEIKDCLEMDGIEGIDNFALVNIHKRIRLKYGDEYGLRIESESGKGTSVYATLPKLENRKRGVESSDVQAFNC